MEKKYIVRLTNEERETLRSVVTGRIPHFAVGLKCAQLVRP